MGIPSSSGKDDPRRLPGLTGRWPLCFRSYSLSPRSSIAFSLLKRCITCARGQGNYAALQYNRKISRYLKEFFANHSSPVPWFELDFYQVTRAALMDCDNMTPDDGTHFCFCPNVIVAKLLLNAACDALGVGTCPTGTSPQLSLGVNCYEQNSAHILRSGSLLPETFPDW